ncbi:hypothetical protein [Streptomyces sp. NPDC047046]|uniref:hypothetical protein n=1 Tax=Streptomyces sp. NPDC047046 TaxID=3155378 RepID=UPI0033EB6C2E
MNRQHTRTYRRRTRLGLPAAALGLAAATVAAAWPPAQATPPPTAPAHVAVRGAHAELARLTLTPVAPLGIGRFHGTYGVADSRRADGTGTGDFTDPDGVLPYLTVTGPKAVRTTGASARALVPGATLRVGGTEWATVRPRTGTPGTYAECAPPPAAPSARGYARADAHEVEVLGHPVPRGTTTLHVSGAELQHPSTVGAVTLTVTYAAYEQPRGGARSEVYAARAGLRLHVSGTIRSTRGDLAHQGDILDLRLGEVAADCAPVTSPSPAPASAGSAPPGTATTGSASPTPSPTPSPSASPSPAPAVPPAPGAPGMLGPGAGTLPGGPGMLAGTGRPAAMWLLGLSATLLLAGTGLVLRARRDIRS